MCFFGAFFHPGIRQFPIRTGIVNVQHKPTLINLCAQRNGAALFRLRNCILNGVFNHRLQKQTGKLQR